MSRDRYVALPRDAIGLSAVCDCGISDHTHVLFLKLASFFFPNMVCKIYILIKEIHLNY